MSDPAAQVVLIEDEKTIRSFLRMTLEAEGLRVCEAETGKHGIIEVAARHPDLVVLDLGLPDVDGVKVIEELRTWTRVPIIILSARSEEFKKVEALDAGADDYLTKPFGSLELLARIRVHLRKRMMDVNSKDLPYFKFGDVAVDFLSRQVTRAGQVIHLTPTEYRLLTTLIRHAGRVLTQTQLLREVWGPGYIERGHYLRIHMGHLRQKLEQDPTRPSHILTATGVGYRLVVE